MDILPLPLSLDASTKVSYWKKRRPQITEGEENVIGQHINDLSPEHLCIVYRADDHVVGEPIRWVGRVTSL